MGKRIELIYKLDNINADDGVDVFEIAPILMHFGELIRSANGILGYEQKIDVRVKPFTAGSWITEFILQGTTNLLNYFKTVDGQNLLTILAFLGFNVKDGIVGVAKIIRFTRGYVTKFTKIGESVTYINDKGEKLTVTLPEHALVQSPLIQINYYHSVITPLEKFPSATGITIKVNKEEYPEQRFTSDDKPAFQQYAKTELFEEVEENVSLMTGVYLKPKRGSYSGDDKTYSFIMGENNILWPVAIEDEDFLSKLQNDDIRLYYEDILKVNLEVLQKKDSLNKIRTRYVITKVIEYIKYEKPKQLNIGDIKNE
ncbi:MAG: hypothetical protein QHH02_01640 [Syntrophomonadaceae bacterium]|nr:hypothetical protein [Syntrophomonadaceae bacterium]